MVKSIDKLTSRLGGLLGGRHPSNHTEIFFKRIESSILSHACLGLNQRGAIDHVLQAVDGCNKINIYLYYIHQINVESLSIKNKPKPK